MSGTAAASGYQVQLEFVEQGTADGHTGWRIPTGARTWACGSTRNAPGGRRDSTTSPSACRTRQAIDQLAAPADRAGRAARRESTGPASAGSCPSCTTPTATRSASTPSAPHRPRPRCGHHPHRPPGERRTAGARAGGVARALTRTPVEPGRPAACPALRRLADGGRGRYRAVVSMPRRTTPSARLARMGFADPARAERLASGSRARHRRGDAELLAALAAAADPDLALAALARMPRDAALLQRPARGRATCAGGWPWCRGQRRARRPPARHPEGWRLLGGPEPLACPSAGELRSALLTAAGADPGAPGRLRGPRRNGPSRTGQCQPGRSSVRCRSRRRAAGGLPAAAAAPGGAGPDRPGDASTRWPPNWPTWRRRRWRRRSPIARSQLLSRRGALLRLAVIAMGKCGGRELNYASDVDVIFVGAAEAPVDGTKTGRRAGAPPAASPPG